MFNRFEIVITSVLYRCDESSELEINVREVLDGQLEVEINVKLMLRVKGNR